MGKTMMEAEHKSTVEIFSYMADLVPKPCHQGKFQQASPETYFFLMEFVDLDSEVVEAHDFCRRVAQLHNLSISPTGKFGFDQVTFQGPNPQITTWESNWSKYFRRLLLDWFDREISINGTQEEYEAFFEEFCGNTIPRILEPLQAKRRQLKPFLIHGDLWEGNTGLNLETGNSVIFDACAMYAHNEMELGMWRSGHNRFGKAYLEHYLSIIPPSEPVEQFDDRNRLYAMKYTLSNMQGWTDTSQAGRQEYVSYLEPAWF